MRASCFSLARPLIAAAGLAVLAACADGTGTSSTPVAAPKPDYVTYSDHFAALQRAGLGGDYAGFARHLKASDPQSVLQKLNRSFGGKPFDVYTRKSDEGASAHRRVVELRSTTGRLYLYLQLDKVTGGWKVASYQLDRNRSAIMARL